MHFQCDGKRGKYLLRYPREFPLKREPPRIYFNTYARAKCTGFLSPGLGYIYYSKRTINIKYEQATEHILQVQPIFTIFSSIV